MAEPTHQIFTGQFSLYAGVLSGASARVSYHGIGGNYLVWMDCHRLGIHSQELEQRLVNEAGLWLNAGAMYGTEGKGFMHWNIACPRTTLAEGLKRFAGFVRNL